MCVCRGTADGFVARILWGFCESFAALAPITKDYPLKLVGGKMILVLPGKVTHLLYRQR